MKLPVRDAQGKELRTLDVDESVFGIRPNMSVLHQAFVVQRNNQRWGTAQTRTRGQVQGSTRKIRMQKYTGRARQGSLRAPHHVGGGTVFGPQRRSYAQALPKKMRRLAIRSALSGKVADGQLVVIDQLSMPEPKTKEMIRILENVGINRSTLIVTAGPNRTIRASSRNLQTTKVLPAAYLNVVDMLNHKSVLMTEEAVRIAEQLWGSRPKAGVTPAEAAAPAAVPKRTRARAKPMAAEAPGAPAPPTPGEGPVRPKRQRRATAPAASAGEPASSGAAPTAKKPARASQRRAEPEPKAGEATSVDAKQTAEKPARASQRRAEPELKAGEATSVDAKQTAKKPARASQRRARPEPKAGEATSVDAKQTAEKPARASQRRARPEPGAGEQPPAEPKPRRRSRKSLQGEV